MHNLLVLNDPSKWPIEIEDIELVSAQDYLTNEKFASLSNTRVYNICRSYGYQTTGYYVSLLAAARGHKPMPSVSTLLDIKNQSLIRFVSEDFEELLQKSFQQLQSDTFFLSIYFGRNVARRYDKLCKRIFSLFPAPYLRVHFRKDRKWSLTRIELMSVSDIQQSHFDFAQEMTKNYLARKVRSLPKLTPSRYDIALLYDPNEKTKPSNERAIENLIRAGNNQRVGIDIISKDDYGRLAEYDALFIRTTTGVNHYTFRFARRAVAEGLVVIDHPDSILRCTNKVYLAELMKKHGIPTPRTLIVHRKNRSTVISTLGLPCIIKQPDSSFSMGVVKVEDDQQLHEALERFLSKSEMVIAQEYMPTDFDWRIGILDNQPLFACKYFMVGKHWQIARRDRAGRVYYGDTEATAMENVPPRVLRTAINAANLIGDGLYGVDLKEVGGKCYLIEINENPNIDAGDEDKVSGNAIYDAIITSFIRRIEARKVMK